MTTSFDNRIKILHALCIDADDYPSLSDFFDYHNTALPYCHGVLFGHITLTAKGIEQVNDCWYNLLTVIDKPDTGFETELDLFPLEDESIED